MTYLRTVATVVTLAVGLAACTVSPGPNVSYSDKNFTFQHPEIWKPFQEYNSGTAPVTYVFRVGARPFAVSESYAAVWAITQCHMAIDTRSDIDAAKSGRVMIEQLKGYVPANAVPETVKVRETASADVTERDAYEAVLSFGIPATYTLNMVTSSGAIESSRTTHTTKDWIAYARIFKRGGDTYQLSCLSYGQYQNLLVELGNSLSASIDRID